MASDYLWPLVLHLMEGLVDFQGHSSSGACVVLNNVIKLRGSALNEQVGGVWDREGVESVILIMWILNTV